MKLTLAIVLGACALFTVQPVMAADDNLQAVGDDVQVVDDTFHALGSVTVENEMTDAELAAVEGGDLLGSILGGIPLGIPPVTLPGLGGLGGLPGVPSLPALPAL